MTRRPGPAGTVRTWRDAAKELSLLVIVLCAYLVGRQLSVHEVDAAQLNAERVREAQQWLHLPSELGVQQQLLADDSLVRGANLYYARVHFPATALFLIWTWWRRLAWYSWARTTLVALTAVGLIGHLSFPLAPPRMQAAWEFIDTAAVYGPSSYGAPDSGVANQYAAMPSLHVGWALLIALCLIVMTRSRWRWLWLAHPTTTVLVVVATANHYWLDAILAAALLGLCLAATIPLLPTRHRRHAAGARARLRLLLTQPLTARR